MNYVFIIYWNDKRFKNKIGGPIKVWELTDNLVKLGNKVTIFTPNIGKPDEQTSAKVYKLPAIEIPIIGIFIFDLILFFRLLFFSLTNKVDIYYQRIMSSLVPVFMSLIFNKPLIFEVHDNPFIRYSYIPGLQRYFSFLIKLIDHITLKRAWKIITVTDNIKQDLIQKSKINELKIEIIQSGSNTDLFKPLDKNQSQSELNLDTRYQYVGFVGIHRKGNDYKAIINSAKFVLGKLPNTKYLIIGDEDWYKEEYVLIKDLGLENVFIIKGFIEYSILPIYINSMDVCIAPFLKYWGHTSAIKLFDYLACAKPLVTSRIGDTGNYLKKADCVVLVEPEDPKALADGIIQILSNPQKASEIGKNGRKLIEQHYARKNVAIKINEISSALRR